MGFAFSLFPYTLSLRQMSRRVSPDTRIQCPSPFVSFASATFPLSSRCFTAANKSAKEPRLSGQLIQGDGRSATTEGILEVARN